jgi:glycosyltransferase involved in cell wall biosynthesis
VIPAQVQGECSDFVSLQPDEKGNYGEYFLCCLLRAGPDRSKKCCVFLRHRSFIQGSLQLMVATSSAKIAYWTYNYAPKWEAASMEVKTLLTVFGYQYDTRLISQNLKSRKVRLLGKHKELPLPFSLLALPFFGRIAASFDINHLFSSPSEPVLLARIGSKNTVLTITKDSETLHGLEKNITHLQKLKYIVVESEWHQELLCQAGINSQKVKLIYPGSVVKPYHPASGPFTILFATGPMQEGQLLSRGIYLLLKAAAQIPDVRFVLIWRNVDYERLVEQIRQEGLENVEVRNGYIPDMERMYQSVHTVILPGLTSGSLKPAPHSALDSLAHGKPVLISRPSSIAGLIERNQCGVVFNPTTVSLVRAIHHLMDHYDEYQRNCHLTINLCFSETVFVESYREIYESMLPDGSYQKKISRNGR